MTRSELEKAINDIQFDIKMLEYNDYEQHKDSHEPCLKLLLAEQKRAAECGVCNIEKIKGLMLDREFRFCPYCGRDLTEGESV